MKKFLSLILALSMIISCVSMVSFVVNAEEASATRIGRRVTVVSDLTANIFPQIDAKFSQSDVVVTNAEKGYLVNGEADGYTTQTGEVSRDYTYFNDGSLSVKIQLTYYAGNASGRGGWDDPKGRVGCKELTISPNKRTTSESGLTVYKFIDGTWVLKMENDKSSYTYTDPADGQKKVAYGYAPLSTAKLRLQMYKGAKANATVIIIPETANDIIYSMGTSSGKVAYEEVFEYPAKRMYNGDAESGSVNWTFWNGHTSTKVIDEHEIDKTVAEGTNHIVEFVPSGSYNSVAFDLSPYILQDADNFLQGNGAGKYTITFRAKAATGATGSFSYYLNSYKHLDAGNKYGDYVLPQHTHISAKSTFTMTDQWQTFSYSVNITDAFLENIYKLYELGCTDAYKLYTRFNGAHAAFKDTSKLFTYYVDDMVVTYTEPTPAPTPTPEPIGVKFEVTEDISGGYPYSHKVLGLTEADVVDGKISRSYAIYNTSDIALPVYIFFQGGSNSYKNLSNGTFLTSGAVPAHSKKIVTISIKVNDDNTVNVAEEPDTPCSLDKLAIRIDIGNKALELPAGTSYIIEPLQENDPVLKINSVAVNGKGAKGKAKATTVADLPDYVVATPTPTPTPTPAPTPHTVVNGDVSEGEVGATKVAGWTTWNGGTNTIVEDGGSKAIHFVPTQMYSSTGFKVSPLVYNDGDLYQGSGVGDYTFTFRARLVNPVPAELDAETAKKAATFTATICSNKMGNYGGVNNTYNTSGTTFRMSTEWQTFTVTIPVVEANYMTWTTVNNDAKNLFLRLDASGSGRAFGYKGKDANDKAIFTATEYMIDDVKFVSYTAPATPAPDDIAIKVTGTGDNTKQTTTTTYTPNPETGVSPAPTVAQKNHFTISNEGVFKGVDFEGKTEKTLEFVVLSDSADTIKIEIYPTIGWKNDMYGAPGLTGDDQYPGTGRITLKPGVPQRVSITIPEVGYLKEAKADSGTSYTKMNLRMNYFNADGKSSRSLIATDVIYILPIDESVIDNYAYSAGMKSVKVAEVPASVELAKNNKIEGANLDIGSTLTVNYYATLAEGYEDAVMKFTRNGKIDTVSGEKQSDGMYKFAYKGINAQCMGDVIDAELVLTDDISLYYNGYSVKKYATNKYNADATEAKDLALNKLLANMLAYGAESQKYQNYKTGELVNAGLDWAVSDELAAPADNRTIEKNTTDGAKVTAVTVNIASEYRLVFKFDLNKDAKVFLGETEITNEINGGVYKTEGLKAHQNDKVFNITVKVGDEVKSSVSYCLNDYINKKYESASVGAIVKSIHSYGEAAKEFIAAMDNKEA